MPTTLDVSELLEALEIEEVAKDPAVYAIGFLWREQKRCLKEKRHEKSMSPRDFQLVLTPDELGFYRTVLLINELGKTHPEAAKKMLQGVFSTDITAHYLKDREKTLKLDGLECCLDAIIKRYDINCDFALQVAGSFKQMNLSTHILEPVESNTDLIKNRRTGFQKKLFGDSSMMLPVERIKKSIEIHTEMQAANLPEEYFEMVSREPTPENLQHFFTMLSEILLYAELHDIHRFGLSIFITLSAALPEKKALTNYDNYIVNWMCLSLILAPSTDIFDQRMRFICAALEELNKDKQMLLPSCAGSELYLPMFSVAAAIAHTDLKHHPAAEAVKQAIDDICTCTSSATIKAFFEKKRLIGRNGEEKAFSPSLLQVKSDLSVLKDLESIQEATELTKIRQGIAKKDLRVGQIISSYFDLGEVPVASDAVREFYAALPRFSVFSGHQYQNQMGVLNLVFPCENKTKSKEHLMAVASGLYMKRLFVKPDLQPSWLEDFDVVTYAKKAVKAMSKAKHREGVVENLCRKILDDIKTLYPEKRQHYISRFFCCGQGKKTSVDVANHPSPV